MTKIIFLDIDGVLNYDSWFRGRFVGGEGLYADELEAATDPACVQRLNMIVQQTGALVVLSSSWRHSAPWEETAQALVERRGFCGTMIGRTPLNGDVDRRPVSEVDPRVFMRFQGRRPKAAELQSRVYPRGYEIQQWLDSNPPCHFVILDDDDDMEHLGPRLVQTDWLTGIQIGHVRRCISMLNDTR